MRRFFVDPNKLVGGGTLVLEGDEFHHLKNVCRLEEGERVELLDGRGKIGRAEIKKMGKRDARLFVMDVTSLPPLPHPEIEIVLCVPRFQKMDLIIQKSVELGAARLSPVVSGRSFVKTITPDLKNKSLRWEKIALEACKQSGRAWPMQILDFESLQEKIKSTPLGRGLFLYEGEAVVGIKSALEKLPADLPGLTVFIGAEGGFSPEEVNAFAQAGFQPVTLGSLVLRVETACIAILSVIQYHFNNMR